MFARMASGWQIAQETPLDMRMFPFGVRTSRSDRKITTSLMGASA